MENNVKGMGEICRKFWIRISRLSTENNGYNSGTAVPIKKQNKKFNFNQRSNHNTNCLLTTDIVETENM